MESSNPTYGLLISRNGKSVATDAEDLQHLGYTQQQQRRFDGFSNFGLSFSVISLLTGAVTLFDCHCRN
jgi:hypothetical protein